MKIKTFLIFSLFFVILLSAGAASADITLLNPLGSAGSDIPTLINRIAVWLLEIGTIIATIVILWAAIIFMTSGGNKERVTKARQMLWYAIIGIVILLVATGLTSVIQKFLSGQF
ncbi:hypothetical protein HY838_01100 [Candidatus Azambacteria bacterium]|nr:hypothetical protein [Candidatus Azambacteria bacterium]